MLHANYIFLCIYVHDQDSSEGKADSSYLWVIGMLMEAPPKEIPYDPSRTQPLFNCHSISISSPLWTDRGIPSSTDLSFPASPSFL